MDTFWFVIGAKLSIDYVPIMAFITYLHIVLRKAMHRLELCLICLDQHREKHTDRISKLSDECVCICQRLGTIPKIPSPGTLTQNLFLERLRAALNS